LISRASVASCQPRIFVAQSDVGDQRAVIGDAPQQARSLFARSYEDRLKSSCDQRFFNGRVQEPLILNDQNHKSLGHSSNPPLNAAHIRKHKCRGRTGPRPVPREMRKSDHRAMSKPSRSRTLRTSSNFALKLPFANRIWLSPRMLENSSHPSSRRMIAFRNPSRP
jgi:hypothetical protein